MAYAHFTLSDLKGKFHVAVELAADVFAAVPPQDLSPFLAETLQENVPLALAVSTEKARSECIVVVGAKNDHLKAELPQCMATMIAAKLFNDPAIHIPL